MNETNEFGIELKKSYATSPSKIVAHAMVN
jgi:hypothetical protein